MNKNEIIIYKDNNDNIECKVSFSNDTLWLSLDQISKVFKKNKSTISRHIRNIFESEELDKNSVVANFATTANDGKTYNVDYYNLDMIISVGYRVNSKVATQFRKWATNILKKYLTDGYAVNEDKLKLEQEKVKTLQNTISLLSRSLTNQVENMEDARQVAQLLDNFAHGLNLLDNFDHKTLDSEGQTKREAIRVTEEEFLQVIDKMKSEFASDVFANPKDGSFASSVNQIYQTFDGQELYPTLEEKAAMLLYLITKNHSFSDGNKRIAASCFLYFMDKNGILYKNEAPIIDNATLFSMTLLIAESNPAEMETIKDVVVSVLNGGK